MRGRHSPNARQTKGVHGQETGQKDRAHPNTITQLAKRPTIGPKDQTRCAKYEYTLLRVSQEFLTLVGQNALSDRIMKPQPMVIQLHFNCGVRIEVAMFVPDL